jgi:hypothetical protein
MTWARVLLALTVGGLSVRAIDEMLGRGTSEPPSEPVRFRPANPP